IDGRSNMAGADLSRRSTTPRERSLGVDINLEVVTLPVAEVGRAQAFSPPHSGFSIQFGKGAQATEPGSACGLILVVKDIEAARDDLIDRGVEISEVQEMKPPGFDAPGLSYFARASFSDPDGNAWQLQEVTTRLPGREWE